MFEVRRFGELDSTNRWLLDEARAGAPEGLVAVAAHQTAGRGRLGRRWEAPSGANLLASVLLRPRLAVDELHLCTVAMALAARSACARACGVEPLLKWPNDLLVGERKVAGILAEAIADAPGPGTPGADRGRAVVVGIGVNLAWPPPDTESGADAVPHELGQASSLWRESGTRIEPALFLDLLLADLGPRVDALTRAEGRRHLASEYRRTCATVGRLVAVSLSHEEVRGTVLDITPEGHLLVDVGVCIRTITAGDVVHLRTPG
jgi:BirA family biotin operon repressor/biotin-[acetyl-CoA-carboxylase] ligase